MPLVGILLSLEGKPSMTNLTLTATVRFYFGLYYVTFAGTALKEPVEYPGVTTEAEALSIANGLGAEVVR